MTPYGRSLQRLNSLYPGLFTQLHNIIRFGDSFLREDAASFIKSFCRRWSHTGLWNYPTLSDPADDSSKMGRVLRGFHRAEVLKRGSVVDRLGLRLSRVLLYHYFEELRIDIQTKLSISELLPSGKDAASVATDKILDEFDRAYSEHNRLRTSEQRRASLQRHKTIGRRWSILATYFGLGIFLTCSPSLEARL
ncbi:hypothetical protein K469DRAFT_548980 [Zopfia rhizophila CBS 207.26]|uniref:Uncharacterized protein n=1 Tax=Zopfia rhizophila CBS 207.26 TaxID=1314779 RepID=A0A6A6ERV6_9PEZI|nr:hypothetical protein K469DRAFT_548980 [Zopfia rhizophila CBS 207.26]